MKCAVHRGGGNHTGISWWCVAHYGKLSSTRGKLFPSFLWLTRDWWWFHSWGGFINSIREILFCNSRGGCFHVLDPQWSPVILNFTWDLVDDLDSWKSFLNDSWSTEGFFFFFFYSFNPLGMLLRAFLSFLDVFLNFPLHFQPSGNLLWILERKNLFFLFFFFYFCC